MLGTIGLQGVENKLEAYRRIVSPISTDVCAQSGISKHHFESRMSVAEHGTMSNSGGLLEGVIFAASKRHNRSQGGSNRPDRMMCAHALRGTRSREEVKGRPPGKRCVEHAARSCHTYSGRETCKSAAAPGSNGRDDGRGQTNRTHAKWMLVFCPASLCQPVRSTIDMEAQQTIHKPRSSNQRFLAIALLNITSLFPSHGAAFHC